MVLFSPGYEDDRQLGTGLVSDLASRGFIVVTIDHTYEAAEVEFPGGRIAVSRQPNTRSAVAKALTVRVADTRFVLDQLAVLQAGGNPDAEHHPLPASLAGSLELSRVGMFGHSLGGATAANAMASDRRIGAGIDLDGSIIAAPANASQAQQLAGSVARRVSHRPFMVMTSGGLGPTGHDPTISGFWAALRGWRRFLTLRDSHHYSYTDEEEFLSQLVGAGIITGTAVAEVVTPSIGTIDPGTAVASERAYVAAFFDLHLRQRDGRLLDGPSPLYPDVQFLAS